MLKYSFGKENIVDENGTHYQNFEVELSDGSYAYGRLYTDKGESYIHLHDGNTGEYMTNVSTEKILELMEGQDEDKFTDYVIRRWQDHEDWIMEHSGDTDYIPEF